MPSTKDEYAAISKSPKFANPHPNVPKFSSNGFSSPESILILFAEPKSMKAMSSYVRAQKKLTKILKEGNKRPINKSSHQLLSYPQFAHFAICRAKAGKVEEQTDL